MIMSFEAERLIRKVETKVQECTRRKSDYLRIKIERLIRLQKDEIKVINYTQSVKAPVVLLLSKLLKQTKE